MYQKTVDYPDEWANGYHVMLDTKELVTVRWDQVDWIVDAHYSEIEAITSDLDAILAYKPWLPENELSYASAATSRLIMEPRFKFILPLFGQTVYTGAWEEVRKNLLLPWHYRT